MNGGAQQDRWYVASYLLGIQTTADREDTVSAGCTPKTLHGYSTWFTCEDDALTTFSQAVWGDWIFLWEM